MRQIIGVFEQKNAAQLLTQTVHKREHLLGGYRREYVFLQVEAVRLLLVRHLSRLPALLVQHCQRRVAGDGCHERQTAVGCRILDFAHVFKNTDKRLADRVLREHGVPQNPVGLLQHQPFIMGVDVLERFPLRRGSQRKKPPHRTSPPNHPVKYNPQSGLFLTIMAYEK